MSLFGQPSAPPQAGFGSAPSQFGAPAQSSSSMFGGSTGQPAPSLFGAPTQSSASLFGAPAQSSQSLFGAPAQSSQSLFGAPAQSSQSLFGAPAQSSSLFGAPQQSSASMFGAPAQSSASLFGAPATQSSMFGAPAQSSSSLFGAPAQGTSLFGAPTQSAPSLFGTGPQQQQQQNAQAPPPEITGRTRIWQLPQNLQTDLFAVERHLREQRNKGSQLWSKGSNFESDNAQTRSRSANITRRLAKLRAVLESLKANSETLKAAVRTERASTEPVVIALENLSKSSYSSQVVFLGDGNSFRYPSSQDQMQDRTTHVPEAYFARIVDELEARAHEYKREIDEIAEFLRAQGVVLSRSTGTSSSQGGKGAVKGGLMDNISQRHIDIGIGATGDSIESRGKTIEDIIRRQYEYFMVVASHIGGVHENLRSIREQFLQLLRSRDPDTLNPFELADRREKAEEQRRLNAEKQAAEAGFGFSSNPAPTSTFASNAASTTQSSLFGGQSGSLGLAGSGFGGSSGATGAGVATGLFGGNPSAPSGAGTAPNPAPNPASNAAKRLATGRRKRS